MTANKSLWHHRKWAENELTWSAEGLCAVYCILPGSKGLFPKRPNPRCAKEMECMCECEPLTLQILSQP